MARIALPRTTSQRLLGQLLESPRRVVTVRGQPRLAGHAGR